MDEEAASTDALVARIAESQHGVVDVGRLRAVDISKDSVWKAYGRDGCIACTAGSTRSGIPD